MANNYLIETHDGDYLVRIEYKPDGGIFHFEWPDFPNKNTYGWEIVYPRITRTLAGNFTDFIYKKYAFFTDTSSGESRVYPTIEQIRQDFQEFSDLQK